MKIEGKIAKADDAQHLVFGWASMAADEDGIPIVDSDGDVIPIDELEQAAYRFVELSRAGGEMHETIGVANLVESCVFTKEKIAAMGLSEGAIPQGYWVGFRVTDDNVWQKVKRGEYSMFSIGGRAKREELT